MDPYSTLAENIERRAERTMDELDRRYMGGHIPEADYKLAVASLCRWVEDELKRIGRRKAKDAATRIGQ